MEHETRVWFWHEVGQETIVNAAQIPRRYTDARAPIPITARVIFESTNGDREEVNLATHAHGWTRDAVYVATPGPLTGFNFTWLRPADVRRR